MVGFFSFRPAMLTERSGTRAVVRERRETFHRRCEGMGMGCPEGSFCTMSFEACALSCVDDADCPDGMACTDLPALERGCMW